MYLNPTNKLRYISSLLLLLTTLCVVGCTQEEPRDSTEMKQASKADMTKDGVQLSASLGLTDEQDDEELRSILFYGRNGNVPHIYAMSSNPTDELIIYLFSRNDSGQIDNMHQWLLHPITAEQAAQQRDGYIVSSSQTGINIDVRYTMTEELLHTVRTQVAAGKRYYIGAMLGGKIVNVQNQDNLLYGIAPNQGLKVRIQEGARATSEERNIPFLTPISTLTAESVASTKWLDSRFRPRGILVSFDIRNDSEEEIALGSITVSSEQLMFDGRYGFMSESMLLAPSGQVRPYPKMLKDGVQSASYDLAQPIRLKPGQTSQGVITLWATPKEDNVQTASVSVELGYAALYGRGRYQMTSQPQIIKLRPRKRGKILKEGMAISMESPMKITPKIPKSVDEINMARWMMWLPKQTPFKHLSLIGTHDSGAYGSGLLQGTWKTQDWNIRQQLDGGVRYFDIRLVAEKDGSLQLYHGIIKLDIEFKTGVLDVMRRFLEDNPSETVIMVLKKEGGTDEEFYPVLQKALKEYNSTNPNVLHLYGCHSDTKLEEVRGRVLVLNRGQYLGIGGMLVGIADNTAQEATLQTFLQDKRFVTEPILFADIYNRKTSWADKKRQIRDAIDYALNSSKSNKLVINNLNQAYYNSTWTPRTMAREYNKYALEYIEQKVNTSTGYPMRSGFVVVDFVNEDYGQKLTKQLVDQCITVNNRAYRTGLKREPPLYTQ